MNVWLFLHNYFVSKTTKKRVKSDWFDTIIDCNNLKKLIFWGGEGGIYQCVTTTTTKRNLWIKKNCKHKLSSPHDTQQQCEEEEKNRFFFSWSSSIALLIGWTNLRSSTCNWHFDIICVFLFTCVRLFQNFLFILQKANSKKTKSFAGVFFW